MKPATHQEIADREEWLQRALMVMLAGRKGARIRITRRQHDRAMTKFAGAGAVGAFVRLVVENDVLEVTLTAVTDAAGARHGVVYVDDESVP